MAKIVFIAPYPDEHNIKEGMLQRIKAIDELFHLENRLYMDISFSKNILYKKKVPASGVTLLKLNFFLHLPLIFYFYLRSEIVYCHSVYNFSKILLFTGLLKKRIVLDLHGVVPEEKMAEGHQLVSLFYEYAEKIAFRSISLAVHVTNQMKDHYIRKHPLYKAGHIIYAIIPAHLKNSTGQSHIFNPGKFHQTDEVVIIYTGNTQVWQNIELMLTVIKENNHPGLKYIILTGEPERMAALIDAAGMTSQNIELKSVAPAQLADYYHKAHYGFILRDDTLINRVANPTKMIEYLNYGIIPIVKSSDIGDFQALGYDYISYNTTFEKLTASKSTKNIQIAKKIISLNSEDDFKKAVLSRTA